MMRWLEPYLQAYPWAKHLVYPAIGLGVMLAFVLFLVFMDKAWPFSGFLLALAFVVAVAYLIGYAITHTHDW